MDLIKLGYCIYKFNKLLRETGSTTPLQLRGIFLHFYNLSIQYVHLILNS